MDEHARKQLQAEAEVYALSKLPGELAEAERVAAKRNMTLDEWLASRWRVVRDEMMEPKPNSVAPLSNDDDAKRWRSLRFALLVDQFMHEMR